MVLATSRIQSQCRSRPVGQALRYFSAAPAVETPKAPIVEGEDVISDGSCSALTAGAHSNSAARIARLSIAGRGPGSRLRPPRAMLLCDGRSHGVEGRPNAVQVQHGKEPALFDRHILSFDIAGFVQSLPKRCQARCRRAGRRDAEPTDHRRRLLLARAANGHMVDAVAAPPRRAPNSRRLIQASKAQD